MRSQLRLDTRGLTVCREHGDGSDVAELSMLNAEAAEAWAQELASRPVRDRGGEYGPEHIARDPRVIFGALPIIFDMDPTSVALTTDGLVTSLPDAAGGAITLAAQGGYDGLRFRLQDHSLQLNPTLGLEGTGVVGHTMRSTVASSALPVTYWGLAICHKWAASSAFIRSNGNACVLGTGAASQTFTLRNGSTTATEVAGPGQGAWFRFVATFKAGGSTLRVGENSMTADVGAVAMSNLLDFIAVPGGGGGPQLRFARFLALSGEPTTEQLDEADSWVRSRAGGSIVAL